MARRTLSPETRARMLAAFRSTQEYFDPRPEETTMSATNETVYVVRDASAEYLRADGKRTPASDEAKEFETREEAQAACERATDRVLEREVE